jgi:thiosulfate/3-mercaptopyruvate sulfurtransferase
MNGLPIVVLAAALVAPGTGVSAVESPARLVTFDELQRRLGEPHLRLLDARPRGEYDKGHIPGALWVDVKAVEALAARPGALTDRAAWESWIEPLGIGPAALVLVYDARRQLDAARLWWLLSYLGVERVGLIDGGFPLWEKQGRPVTTEVPKVAPRAFPVRFRTQRLATRADVLDAVKGGQARVIDARSEAEHTGVEKRSKRAGRVPAACLLEWSYLVDQDGRFLDEVALRAKVAQGGVKPGEPVITHCQSGGRASVDAFVFERLGFPTRNYYLGWSDWGNAEDTPVETGPATKPGPR